ncbi:MAG: hypothetical protein ACOZAA_03385 [Pseudomonadota bacterium]
MNHCPIWKETAEFHPATGDYYDVESARAGGRYRISGTLARIGISSELRSRLTTWLIDQRRLGNDSPEVHTLTMKRIERQSALSVQSRAERLLGFMADNTPSIGKHFCFAERYINTERQSWEELDIFSRMKAWSESEAPEDVYYLLNYLAENEYVACVLKTNGEYTDSGTGQKRTHGFEYAVKPRGYAHLESLRAKAINSSQAFVAMWFSKSMDGAYDGGIDPAIRDAGYVPMKIDKKEHNNKIDDEIIAEIRRSRFLVADFTQGEDGARGGVYYEAGFAHGLNIPVIFSCRDNSIGKVHFDTQQYNHITWETPADLRSKLARRISATIGDGPLKKQG